jgi:hypothetical protein
MAHHPLGRTVGVKKGAVLVRRHHAASQRIERLGNPVALDLLRVLLHGHRKSVLASYYAADGRLLGALGSSVVLIITHVGLAVVPLLAVLLRTRLLPVMAHTEAWRRSDRSRIGGCRGRRRCPVGSLAAVSTVDFCSAECGAVRP